jgi:hypothetical protein
MIHHHLDACFYTRESYLKMKNQTFNLSYLVTQILIVPFSNQMTFYLVITINIINKDKRIYKLTIVNKSRVIFIELKIILIFV